MTANLTDFVRMAATLKAAQPQAEGVQTTPSEKPLTVRILEELASARSTSSELASVLGLNWKIVAGTLSNMKKQQYVKVNLVVDGRRGPGAFMYEITNAGQRRLHESE